MSVACSYFSGLVLLWVELIVVHCRSHYGWCIPLTMNCPNMPPASTPGVVLPVLHGKMFGIWVYVFSTYGVLIVQACSWLFWLPERGGRSVLMSCRPPILLVSPVGRDCSEGSKWRQDVMPEVLLPGRMRRVEDRLSRLERAGYTPPYSCRAQLWQTEESWHVLKTVYHRTNLSERNGTFFPAHDNLIIPLATPYFPLVYHQTISCNIICSNIYSSPVELLLVQKAEKQSEK